jgi:hypothetical protein
VTFRVVDDPAALAPLAEQELEVGLSAPRALDEDPGGDDIAFRHLRFGDCAP